MTNLKIVMLHVIPEEVKEDAEITQSYDDHFRGRT
jgi:hypothetical protein